MTFITQLAPNAHKMFHMEINSHESIKQISPMRHTHTYNSSAFCCPLYKITESTSAFVGIITDFTMRKRRFLIQPSLCQGNGLLED